MGGDGPKYWKDSERIANVEAGSHTFLPVTGGDSLYPCRIQHIDLLNDLIKLTMISSYRLYVPGGR